LGGDNGNSRYPHQEFKIKAADEKGHFERIQLRIPPQMFSKMQKVVNSKIWPFENYQELARHAIMKELAWLESDAPEVGNLTAQVQNMHAMMHEETEFQVIEDTLEKMKAVFSRNLAVGGEAAKGRNLKLVCDMWGRICSIDDVYWRDIWKQRFQEEYDKVLQAAPDVGLGELEEDDGVE
jgi:hypothetical protein